MSAGVSMRSARSLLWTEASLESAAGSVQGAWDGREPRVPRTWPCQPALWTMQDRSH